MNQKQLIVPRSSFLIYFATFAPFSAFVPEWPLNVRVGANSPSLCPTMFSVTYTGTCRLPLCTPNVSPTKSGVIVERRDHVLIAGGRAPPCRTRSTVFSRG